jgi:WD40 repeat protein
VTTTGTHRTPGKDRQEADPDYPPDIPDHKLLRPIGRGGYGEVWLARNSLDAYRAVKIVYRSSFKEDRPFHRELEGIRKFEPISRLHEGLVDILHVGVKEGYFYYIMELGDDLTSGQTINPDTYQARTLSAELDKHGRLDASSCVELGLALSKALQNLHAAGCIHRDIKPANILFVNSKPQLADIGLVTDMKASVSFVGTDGYMPPEGPITFQSDIYGLGKTLYETSTGCDRHSYPEIPEEADRWPDRQAFLELNEIVTRACHSQPGLRYKSAEVMHADLEALHRGKSIKQLRLREQQISRAKRLALTSLGVVTVVAGLALFVRYQRQTALAALHRERVENVTKGNQAMNNGDFLGALPYFAEAERQEPENPPRLSDELRLGAVLEQCPKLTHLWFGTGAVTSGQFSPDGSRILLARSCGNVETYDLQTGRQRLLKPSPALSSAAYSPDGRFLVTICQPNEVCIWSAKDFMELRRVPHASRLWSARFSPDGSRLVTAANDGVARIWDVSTGRLVFALKHWDVIRFSDFSHNGRLIVTTSQDGTARLWEAEHGDPAGPPLAHGGWVTHAAFSPDDQKLVSASLDRKARVWDTGTCGRLLPDMDHSDGVATAEFSPDGRAILTASQDGKVQLWSAERQQPADLNPVLRHPAAATGASFGTNGHQILTTCADGSAWIWDLATGSQSWSRKADGFSADGSRLFLLTSNGVEVCESVSGRPVSPPPAINCIPQRAVLSEDGRFLATVSAARSAGTNHLLRIWELGKAQPPGPQIELHGVPAGISLAPHGEYCVVFGGNHVQTWDARRGTPLSPPLTCEQPVSQAFFSRDGKDVVSLSGNEVRVWDARTGRGRFAPIQQAQAVRSAQFSPDGQFLAVGCSDQQLAASSARVYNAKTGRPIGRPLNHQAGVLHVCFSPDSRRLITASADFTAVIWDFSKGRALSPPLRHQAHVRHAAFSPDGRWVVTLSADRTLRIWGAESGEPLTPPLRSLRPLDRTAFLADGHQVLGCDAEGNGEIWNLPLETRPTASLQPLVRLLSGGAPSGTLGETDESLETIWRRLRTQSPRDFEVSMANVIAWHESAAEDSKLKGQSTAAAFHLARLHSLRTNQYSSAKELMPVQRHALGH